MLFLIALVVFVAPIALMIYFFVSSFKETRRNSIEVVIEVKFKDKDDKTSDVIDNKKL